MKQYYQELSSRIVKKIRNAFMRTPSVTPSSNKLSNDFNNTGAQQDSSTHSDTNTTRPFIECVAQNIVDSHFNGDKAHFMHNSRVLEENAIEQYGPWVEVECNSYFLLSQALFYTLTKNFNPQIESNRQTVIFTLTHYYLLKTRREMEKGNISYEINKYTTLCKQLCYLSSEYRELLFKRIDRSGLLPNASMETYVYQILGLSIVNYMTIQDKGLNVISDEHTENCYENFIKNNQKLIKGGVSPTNKEALYNHIHENEDALLCNYECIPPRV